MSNTADERQVETRIGGREVVGAWILVGVLFVAMTSGSVMRAIETGILEPPRLSAETVLEY